MSIGATNRFKPDRMRRWFAGGGLKRALRPGMLASAAAAGSSMAALTGAQMWMAWRGLEWISGFGPSGEVWLLGNAPRLLPGWEGAALLGAAFFGGLAGMVVSAPRFNRQRIISAQLKRSDEADLQKREAAAREQARAEEIQRQHRDKIEGVKALRDEFRRVSGKPSPNGLS
jgi:hypothetical protein